MHIHGRSLSWLGSDTSMQSGEVTLVLRTQVCHLSEMMRPSMCSLVLRAQVCHLSEMMRPSMCSLYT